MSFYERGAVRIHFAEAGSGFPLLLIPGGGLNSTMSNFTGNSPFNPIEVFKGEYRCITPICAMPMAASLRVRSKAIAHGTLMRTINSD